MRRPSATFPGLSVGSPRIAVTVSTKFFFDKREVMGALNRMEQYALSRSSLLVRRTAQKSITKMGAAKPKLKIETANPGALPSSLLRMQGLRKSTRRALEKRVVELKFRPASPPGTPPHTHVPYSHMLGFRRNLYNAVEPISLQRPLKSAIVGPEKRGDDWRIPHLHEFGGRRTLHEFVYRPSLRWRTLVTKYVARGDDDPNWEPTGRSKSATYPPRPFMLPALQKCLPQIRRMFGGQLKGRRG